MKPTRLAAPTIITCHANADWDALASVIGLLQLYPEAVPVFPGSMEAPLNRFYDEALRVLYPFVPLKDIDPESVELVVLADTRRLSRAPHIRPFTERGVRLHVWDHHPDADPALRPELEVAERAGSTCTLICRELRARGIRPTCQDATILGLGIYGDTGAFSFNSTGPEDFAAAAWLREHDMDLPLAADLTRHDMNGPHIRILGALLESARRYDVGSCSLVLAEVSMDEFMNDFALPVQRLLEMEPCDALFALGRMRDRVQVVARSRSDEVDVGAICKTLGGGGHSSAASASVKDKSSAELKDMIFSQVFAQVHTDRTAGDLMSSPAVGVDSTRSVHEAETVMNRYGLKAAPVFRPGTRHCIGYMECQLASRAVAHGIGDLPVGEYMQRRVLTAHPGTSLQRLMDIIVGARQRLVPVVEHGNTVGVVTRTDLINMFVEEPDRIPLHKARPPREKDLARTLAGRLPRRIVDLLRTAGALADRLGVNAYAVGGLVRDILLGRPTEDFDDVDIVVEGDGIAFGRELASELGGRIREHREFMTALVICTDASGREQRLDVATARLEYYRYPAALPTVELSSIKMDLFRRDFTINAMAVRLNEARFGHLVDFFDGRTDIQRRVVRIIHALSFVEDPTRIIRAIRFEQRYGFRLAAQTEKLIRNALSLHLVEKLSGRRILHELTLIFNEHNPPAALIRLNELGVPEAVHPAFALNSDRVALLEDLREVLDWYRLLYLKSVPDMTRLYLTALLSGVADNEAHAVCERLELGSGLHAAVSTLREAVRTLLSRPDLRAHREDAPIRTSKLCSLLSPLPLEGLLYLMAKTRKTPLGSLVSRYIYRWRQIKSDVTGEDLRRMGLPEGPICGEIIRRILAARLDGEAETHEERLALARKLVNAELKGKEPEQPSA